nr:5969_t:CDS:2 [Entrophospora candida]
MNVENNREDWLLWQISDSALPTGGFVASSGLESAIQTGYVHDIPSLSIFLSSSIDNYAFSSLPFVTGSWNIGNTNNEEEKEDKDVILRKIMELDDLYDSCTSNHVAKRASKAQGVAIKELACGHLPVCFGLVTRYLGISLGDYLYHFIW